MGSEMCIRDSSITCSGATATNYSFSYTPAALTINKASTLSITAVNQTITYGAATPTNSVTAFGLAPSDGISSLTYTYAGTGSTTYAANTQAPTLPGTYSITPSAAVFTGSGSADNYNTITYNAGTYTINKGTLIITAVSSGTTTYGTPLPGLNISTSGLGQGATVGSVTYTYRGTGTTSYGPSETAPRALGTYSITPSGALFSAGDASYFSAISYVPGFFSITRASATIVPTSTSVVYGSASPTLAFRIDDLKYSETISDLAGYSSPTCASTYTPSTAVVASPVSVTCSGGAATNYIFTGSTASVLSVTPRTLTVVGTTISDRTWTGTSAAGAVNIGTLSGLVNSDAFTVSATASPYSSSDAGTYTSTITYSLLSVGGSDVNNYSVAAGTASGTINPARTEFTVTPTLTNPAPIFSIDYAKSDTLTVSATTGVSGVVTFKVSVAGADFIDIASCPAVSLNPDTGTVVAANCIWPNPTVGSLVIRATFTPSNLSANAIVTTDYPIQVVAKPTITTFRIRGTADTKVGAIGSILLITGENFLGITSVKFNGVSAPSGSFRATSTQVTVTVPAGATTGKITVETDLGGAVTSTDTFTVTS